MARRFKHYAPLSLLIEYLSSSNGLISPFKKALNIARVRKNAFLTKKKGMERPREKERRGCTSSVMAMRWFFRRTRPPYV